MVRHLALCALALAACGGAALEPRDPMSGSALSPDDRKDDDDRGEGGSGEAEVPPPGCAEARAMAEQCRASLDKVCDPADPDCKVICAGLEKRVVWACEDRDHCTELTERTEACYERLGPVCAPLQAGSDACQARAEEFCAPLRELPREELEKRQAELDQCNLAIEWCDRIFNQIAWCLEECMVLGMDARDACWVQGRG